MQRCRWPPYFYPRPPRGGRLCRFRYICGLQFHFYPRPPRGGRRSQASAKKYNSAISIHALREEGDATRCTMVQKPKRFLSTPSARRATRIGVITRLFCAYFYPRPPRGGRRISKMFTKWSSTFLSTPSARRATVCIVPCVQRRLISIHALREEGDQSAQAASVSAMYISIHALREEGDVQQTDGRLCGNHFYPRPPRGGRRRSDCLCPVVLQISIHALREEGDPLMLGYKKTDDDFYPRPPRGGRPNYRIR